MKKINKFIAILIAVLGVQVASAQTTIISNGDNLNKQCNFGSVSNHTIPEIWTSDKRQGFNLSQSVELPNGVYTLSFQMMYRASLVSGTPTNCALYAETSGEVYNTPIKNFGDESGVAESLNGVTSAMNAGKYLNTIPYFVVTDGKATVGARSLGALTYCTNGYWTIFNPASFKLVSVVDDATLTTALNDVKAEAKAILDAAASSDAKNTLQAAYDAATATNDGIVALKKAIKAYLPNTGTAANPVDVSSLILSADFSQKAFIVATKNNNGGVTVPELQPVGWSCADGGSGQYNFFNVVDNNTTYDGQSNFAYNGKTTGQTLYMRNAWSDNVTISAKQTVTLPNGRYKISIPAKKSGNTATIKYTFAGETETHDLTTSWNVYEKVFTVNDVNNTLTIELSYFHPSGGGQRAFFDGVTLLCYGDPIAALLTEIASKKNELETFNGNIPSSLYGSFNAHLTSAGSANNTQTEAELQEIIDNLSADIVKASNALTPYKNLKSLISLCTEYTDTKNSNANDGTILTNFQIAISTATTSGDAALNVDEINTAYNNLESARQIYAQNAVPVYPYPFDMTFLIGNATFDSNIDGWTKSGGAGWMSAGNVECYNNTFTFSKLLTGLGSGSWEVSVDGFYRYGGYNNAESAHNGGTEVLNVKFYANANEVALMSIMEGAGKAGDVGVTTTGGVRVPNGPAEGNIYFAAGCYKNTVATIVTDGKLNIGLKKETTQGSDWTLFDNFKLVYKGIDVSELQASLTALIAKAEGVKSSVMGKAEKTNLTSALDAADATVTVADNLNKMISDLQSAYDAAVISIDTYSKVPAYITKANKIDASIAETYQTNYDNRTLVGDAETIRQELNVATFKYVEDNFKNEIALTEWGAERNAMWSTSGEHWDGTSGEGCTSYYDANGTNTTHTLSKEVELTPGTYVFRAAGRSNSNTELSLSISIDGVDPVIFNAKGNTGRGIDKTGNATFADDAEYARDGQGQGWEWEFIKFTLNEKTTVTLTATSKTSGWGWASFANNGLWMDDATYLIANASALEKPMATAQELLDQPMNVEKKTALQEAMDLPATTVTEFNAKIASLETAIDEAKISIEEYKEILTYINKANKIDESIAASYQTQYDKGTIEGSVEVVFQALEIATYNYVKDNFTYDVALSDTWNSTGTNTKAWDASGEHWDGNNATTYKNQYDGWGDPKQGYPANSWSIDFNQEVALPAGEYVFKVAGRKSVDATLELNVTKGETVLGTVNDFPSSNNALGINKAGAASFDAEDQAGFANNGSGFGWQWRYVKFTLTENSTVKVAVHAETNKIYNWVSFGNYTLQMTEETYMAAGQPELDAALDAAQALVGTKPMGTDEETALNEAIALPVTTGAEQKAKVNALNTAVENIKTWRATYYAEKDKLVAALERFETDYNDAENGSLDYMNKNRWATVIEKAQAAAVAKDNQTSHAVLTTATNELTEALDTATVSVNEYAALKSAIDEAKTLVAANVGDQPFERPQSAADAISTTEEQALYNEATADGEDVTSVTDALTEGIATFNNTPLNAPKDGARYNLVLNNNYGWTYDGKAVTYLANDRSDMGLYNIQYWSAVNANYAQAFTFTAVDGQQDCYYISMTDLDGNERYVSTGVVYGGNANQIRTTTNAEDALAVKVIATKTDGVHNLYNVEASNYIGSQDAGFYTVNSHINFNIQEASTVDVTLTISSAKWSTLILPFNAELPEGVKAYTCAGVIDGVLTFNEATTIKANTPYLVGGNAGKYDFSGYGLADKDVYTEGLFTGTYVDYQTEAGKHIYVLQKHDNEVAFYEVRESAQPWVRANRCYITYESASEARVLRLGFDDTSGIDNVLFPTDNSELTIYDTMGRKVKSMKKGSLYIINGKKVVVN